MTDAQIEALASALGLDKALAEHRDEVLAAARRAFAQRAALAQAIPPELEPLYRPGVAG